MENVFSVNLPNVSLQIRKRLIHDDISIDDEVEVFVRGNGFWIHPVKWLNANDLSEKYKENEIDPMALDGTFLIVIHDKKEGVLQIITDHLNFFPIYIQTSENSFKISDSLRSFQNTSLDELAIQQLFSIQMLIGNRTLYDSVKKLPPAHIISIDKAGIVQKEYWQCDPIETDDKLFKEILSKTIHNASHLSGNPSLTLTAGLDSRMVFSELYKQNIPFQAFTFGHKNAIDVTTAHRIASDFGVTHRAYQIDENNSVFLNDLESQIQQCVDFSDGMIPFIKGVAANYCFQKESEQTDLILTATGELVYSHYAEVPTLRAKDKSSIEAISQFLIQFNADSGRPSMYHDLGNIVEELSLQLKKYEFENKNLYYDIFYLEKLSGLTSYFQQFLSSGIRIYNPIFTKEMINHSMGLHQSLRDHRKLQREIIVSNDSRLNKYLVNGFKVVKPTFTNKIQSTWNYGLRLLKKVTNKLLGGQKFRIGYLDYLPMLKSSGMLENLDAIEKLEELPTPKIGSSEHYVINYLSFKKWFS